MPGSARECTLRIMTTPRLSTLVLATSILWALGWALWVTNFLLDPPPFVVDHSLRGIPVFMFGAMLCLAVGRMLGWLQSRTGEPLCASPVFLTMVVIVAVIAATLVLSLFYEFVMHMIVPRWGSPTWKNVLEQMPMMSWLFVAWALLYFALVTDADRRDREVRLAQATTAARDAQHRLLVQQINPHFLFNALNTVYALVLEHDEVRAQRCLLALSAFMRASIDRNAPRSVPLSSELASVRHYLDIELIRFGDRLRLDESVQPGVLGMIVPALILQPLVENCIKHGLSGNTGSMTIWLSAALENDELVLSVENDGRSPPKQDAQAAGVGLNNVRERLHLLYGDNARLVARARTADGFIARVHLPAS